MGKLQGKVAVITGATQGIGLATAKLFVSEGAYVFITGRRHKELEEAVASIGSNVTGVQGDASNLADLDRLYESVKARGRVDILFTNAGLGGFLPLGVSPRSITTRSSIRTSGGCSSPSRRRSRF
jgi:NAD(P)-dependent dehydrogenase (short-subunit alcohol dehydrogenase family)